MILLTVTMLASCEQKETASIDEQKEMKEQQISEELLESFKNSQTDQTDKIVNVYKLFSKYIDIMGKNPDVSQTDTYKKRSN